MNKQGLNKKTLLVSGDSWTSGWPREETLGHREFTWPSLVAKHVDMDLVDKSRAGSSNYRIYRKIFDGMLDSADLAIVCLTSWVRFETGATFGPSPGGIYQHVPKDKNSKEAYKLFFNGYKNYTDMLRQIISLQAIARTRNVPCFFLDTFSNNLYRSITKEQFKDVILKFNIGIFDNLKDDQIDKKFQTVKCLEASVDWSKFISENSYQDIVAGSKFEQSHPVEDGHNKIAEVIINFLEGLNYGKTI